MPVSTTYRASIRTNVFALLTAFKAANPTLVNQIYRSRPASLHPPAMFIGSSSEPTIAFDMSILTRQPQVEVWLVQGEYESGQTMDRQDVLVDTFLSYLLNQSRVGGGDSVLINLSYDDRDLPIVGQSGSQVTYLCSVFLLGLDLQEGGLS